MGTRGETLAKQFEAKVQEALAVVEQLSDVDWKKVTTAEHWPVGVTAHHLANAFEIVPGVVTAIVSGDPRGGFTRAMLDQGNAHHAGACPLHESGDSRAAQEGRGGGRRDHPRSYRRSAVEERARLHGRTADDRRAAHPRGPDPPRRRAHRQHSQNGRSLRGTLPPRGATGGLTHCCGTLPSKVHLPSAVHGRRVSGGDH